MKKNKLRINICSAVCPSCKLPSDFLMFEPNSPGGEFSTYHGITTNNIYRVNLGDIYYLKKTLPEILQPAIELEGGENKLLKIPNAVKCNFCDKYFHAKNIRISCEKTISAVEL